MWPQDPTPNSRSRRSVSPVIPSQAAVGVAPPADHAAPSERPEAQASHPTSEPEGAISPPAGLKEGPPIAAGWLLQQEEETTLPSQKVKRAPPASGTRLFVYVDFIRPSLCSDFRGKCLRILAIDRKKTHISLNPVYYYPVEKKVIDGIFVEIKDKQGEYFNFDASDQATVLVLHFKRA